MELLTVEETLPYFKVKKDTFYTWIKNRKLPEGLILKIGNTTRIRKSILDKILSGELAF